MTLYTAFIAGAKLAKSLVVPQLPQSTTDASKEADDTIAVIRRITERIERHAT